MGQGGGDQAEQGETLLLAEPALFGDAGAHQAAQGETGGELTHDEPHGFELTTRIAAAGGTGSQAQDGFETSFDPQGEDRVELFSRQQRGETHGRIETMDDGSVASVEETPERRQLRALIRRRQEGSLAAEPVAERGGGTGQSFAVVGVEVLDCVHQAVELPRGEVLAEQISQRRKAPLSQLGKRPVGGPQEECHQQTPCHQTAERR